MDTSFTAGRYDQTASTSASDAANEDHPLLKLMKILSQIIDNEEKTMLTDYQLVDILQKEFRIDASVKTEFEVDVYLNVLKKFLKSWPWWEQFKNMIQDSKTDPGKNVEAILATECEKLKTYLKRILTMTEEQMAPALQKLQKTKPEDVKELKENEVVLEVTCSRSQLNKLFLKTPHEGTIFSITKSTATSEFGRSKFALVEILNWPQVSVTVSLPWFEVVRTNSTSTSRTLKNMKLEDRDLRKESELSREIYWRKCHGKNRLIEKAALRSFFKRLINRMSVEINSKAKRNHIVDVLTQFKCDLDRAPHSMLLNSEYQFFLNRSPYIRYLSADPPEMSTENDMSVQYNLQLEEIISPAVTLQVTKLEIPNSGPDALKTADLEAMSSPKNHWLKIECMLCRVIFVGSQYVMHYKMQQHFSMYHSMEADWTCPACRKVFTMKSLACKRWQHECRV